MAKRGMLPKFRPAQLGREASARPTIRPVKASPPPPPPSPPRRMASGFSPKTSAAAAAALAPIDSEGDRATAIASYGDPATLDRANAHAHHAHHSHARNDEELPSTTAVPRGRVDAMLVSFEDETQARQPDDHVLDGMRGEPTLAPFTQAPTPPVAEMNVPYDSLPSLEVRRPYDTYEAEFAERDPVTAMHAQHDSAHVRRAEPATHPAETRAPDPAKHLPSFRDSFSSLGADSAAYDQRAFNDPDFNARAPRNDLYDDGAYRELAPPVNDYDPSVPSVETEAPPAWNAQRREESGPRERPRNDYEPAHSSPPWNGRDLPYDMHDAGASRMMDNVAPTGFSTMPPSPEMAPLARESYPAPEPYIPPAPRVPAEARVAAPFVMGVQPIRANANHTDAWPPAPVMMPMQAPPQQQQQHYNHLPSPMQAMQMHQMQHASSMPPAYAQPQPYVNASPRMMATTPQPGSLSPQVMPHAHASERGQHPAPMGTTMGAQPANRIGRFAWFVAGVAFGITFAIFATGFFGTGSATAPKAASEPPPAATAPVAPAQTVAAPAVTTAAPAAAPVPPPPPASTVATTTPSSLPAAGAAAAPAPVAPAAAPRPAPVAKAAPPVIRRSAPRRQFNAPATSEARPVRAGGDDEGGGGGGGRSAAPPPEASDLLGAGLR